MRIPRLGDTAIRREGTGRRYVSGSTLELYGIGSSGNYEKGENANPDARSLGSDNLGIACAARVGKVAVDSSYGAGLINHLPDTCIIVPTRHLDPLRNQRSRPSLEFFEIVSNLP